MLRVGNLESRRHMRAVDVVELDAQRAAEITNGNGLVETAVHFAEHVEHAQRLPREVADFDVVAFRFEQTTETPADRTLVRRIAVDLYLEPKRPPGAGADRPRVIRLTRRWIFSGTFGHNTSKQVGTALDAAERLDYAPPVVGRNTLDAR